MTFEYKVLSAPCGLPLTETGEGGDIAREKFPFVCLLGRGGGDGSKFGTRKSCSMQPLQIRPAAHEHKIQGRVQDGFEIYTYVLLMCTQL